MSGTGKSKRGFASMDVGRQREIASKGGRAAHQKGTAHEWTSEEAREAGRKGGMASHRRKQEQTPSAWNARSPRRSPSSSTCGTGSQNATRARERRRGPW